MRGERGRFLKGEIPTDEERQKAARARIGQNRSTETKAKISAANKGKPLPEHIRQAAKNWQIKAWQDPVYRSKMCAAFKGRPHRSMPEGAKRKLSLARKGKPRPIGFGAKLSAAIKEHPRSDESRKRQSLAQKGRFCGEKSSNWKGGITPQIIKARNAVECKVWKDAVYSRDGRACRKCGTQAEVLNAHHILNFAEHEGLRYVLENGITFCKSHHERFHAIYGRRRNSIEQLEEFLNADQSIKAA